MALRQYATAAQQTTLSAGVSSGTTTMTITAAVGLPASVPWTAIVDPDTVNEEVVEVTSRSGTTLTVTRGVDGSSALAHSAGAVFQHGVSARDFAEPNAHVNDSTFHVPSQTGNAGKYMTTNGTAASWAALAIPDPLNPFFL